jgi:NADPH:quinone reductase-like Zn-dependent oxidoreductase
MTDRSQDALGTPSIPDRMRALVADDFSIEALRMAEKPAPRPRRGEIMVRIKAASLNYRDLAILIDRYLPNLKAPYVPASDCCGEVVAIGDDVTRFKVGDRVIPIYTQGWHDGCRRSSCARSAHWARRSTACCRNTWSCPPRTQLPRPRT